MVLKIIEKNDIKQFSNKIDFSKNHSLNPLRLAIPFEEFFKKKTPPDIYSGIEFIPFEQRDPLYKSILRKEFSKALEEFHKNLRKYGI